MEFAKNFLNFASAISVDGLWSKNVVIEDSTDQKVDDLSSNLNIPLAKEIVFNELNWFGKICIFERSFIDNEFANWLSDLNNEMSFELEEKLCKIPFEQAYRYKNPEFYGKTNTDILSEVFKDSFEWRYNPKLVQKMTKEEQQIVYNNFEYMLYYVINTRDEIEFDINNPL